MFDIDFRQIVSRCGGQHQAFEEICCQLAHSTIPEDIPYTRLHGAGGDGGLECFSDSADGKRVGWQAKYVFDIGSLLTQTTKSLTTALKIHPTISRYVVCFPFDLTGPTRRKGQSGQEKFDEWCNKHIRTASAEGRQLTIEAWSASKLRELLMKYDTSGGAREFFFNQKILTNEWFSSHLEQANQKAGPRYTPELNVKTDLWRWFAAFGRTATWSGEFRTKLQDCREKYQRFAAALKSLRPDPAIPEWPEGLRQEAQKLIKNIKTFLDKCDHFETLDNPTELKICESRISELLEQLRSLESHLVDDLDTQHGQGKADSPGFRQYMAEYMLSFPASNLDNTRETIAVMNDLHEWFHSPAYSLSVERVFVLAGVAGSGKTHGACDAASRRLSENLLTCVIFGHEFRGEPDPWTRLLESLGLPITLGMEGLLDALNAAGEASGAPLILCIDAINETRPLIYWRNRLSTVSHALQNRPYVRLCITCRTSFISYCLPEGHKYPILEHVGFRGIERDACRTFFNHYDLEPPLAPILQPELSNPLYLRLLCETLRSRGLRRMPSGWYGLAPTIRAFLSEKERQFAAEYETSLGAKIVSGCLMGIVREIVDKGESALAWSQAQRIISDIRPQTSMFPVLEWLVRADLLVEDAPDTNSPLGYESVIRPAFERLGDFLVAEALLEKSKKMGLDVACQPGGLLHALFKDSDALEQNHGALAALSILVPEQIPALELPNLVDEESVRSSLLRIAVRSFPSRDPSSFSATSSHLIQEALGLKDFSSYAMDAALSTSWHQSAIDAFWLDEFLKKNQLARRDAFWCGYLHERFESHGTVHRLIDAAFELPLEQLEHDIAERWAVILLWFTAAADRRVKDKATRAVTAILTTHLKVLPSVLQRFINCDDDEIRERTLLSCYGALILARDIDLIGLVTSTLLETYRQAPEAFDNALLRDHIRCISELARELNALPDGCDPELPMQPIFSEWPLQLPSDTEVNRWDRLPKLAHSCFDDDFFFYSMGCLEPWAPSISKKDMGKWILQRVAGDFAYEGSGGEEYDSYMLTQYGGGRSKPSWAERIGKKYQWLAMYQLASRLHDHAVRETDDWEPEPMRTPLILLEERKLDPTLPSKIPDAKHHAVGWWIKASTDLGSTDTLSNKEWVEMQDDVQGLETLLSVVDHDGQSWRMLASYSSWVQREEYANRRDPYRQVWMHVQSYLVKKREFATAYESIHCRNFFGGWMPKGATWLYGFTGEYPWATPFNTEPDEWHGRGGYGTHLPVGYNPSWNHLAVEWEYDASVPRNFHMTLPAKNFFSPRDLWWDGIDGYRLVNGRTVFRDPSVTQDGPPSLLADAGDLLDRLDKIGMRLIWTLLGEKRILGEHHDSRTPMRTFSQVAHLNEEGSLQIGKRVFFLDYNQDTGPLSKGLAGHS
ncbi:MAG TPA: hypothetical protein PKJ63_10385 [Cyclobacteriaceae bacterium]|nr:hypothetical protein [Cyclobacteriaceae bacterium]